MQSTAVAALLVTLMLCGPMVVSGAERQDARFGTFSSLSFNKEGGDLLGVELKIVPARRGSASVIQGALQISDGEPSEIMVVDIAIEGSRIRFAIPSSYPLYGGRTFEGTIDRAEIKGRFGIKGGMSKEQRLRRGKSYWDKLK